MAFSSQAESISIGLRPFLLNLNQQRSGFERPAIFVPPAPSRATKAVLYDNSLAEESYHVRDAPLILFSSRLITLYSIGEIQPNLIDYPQGMS